jgi:hypothetical protein
MGLYPQVMGDRWAALPDVIKRAHAAGPPLHGSFQVRHGRRWLARTLARLLRVPRAAAEVPVTLRIEAGDATERWHRVFGNHPLMTRQRCGVPGHLHEQLGVLDLGFHLEAAGNELRYEQIDARFRLGGLSLPWPRWCRPHVSAVETAEPGGVRVSVDVTLPRLGLLVGYRGRLEVPEPAR